MSDDLDLNWINGFAARHDLDGLTPELVDALLDLAGRAAHDTGERRNAPLACFLAGLALAGGARAVTAAAIAEF